MLSFDLRWPLFGLLLIIVTTVLLTVWLERRRCRKAAVFDPEGVAAVLERAPCGWLVLDGSRSYCYANPYARRALGLAAPTGPLPEAEWVALLDQDRATAQRGLMAPGYRRTASLPSGTAVCWWIVPWRDLDVVFLLDVTGQQRAEQAAAYLFSGFSHELRTPIATILTHLEILLLPDISEEIRQQSLRLLKAETRRMARLVNQMLELGRLETSADIEHRLLDPVTLVQQAIAQITPQAEERGIAISLDASPWLPIVVGDEDRLMQVFLNVLDNVVKYCRPGDRAVVSLQRSAEGIECVVQDTGPGIPTKHLPHLTRRFYRAAPQEIEGSGLGLALVEEILHRHGSRLEIESRTEGKGTGTRVRFVLPVLPDEEEQ